MVTYPIHVPRSSYRGNAAAKKRKEDEKSATAAALETYVNGLLQQQTEPIKVYTYHAIARATGFPEDLVMDLCFRIDGGHTGFTALRVGLTLQQAMDEQAASSGG